MTHRTKVVGPVTCRCWPSRQCPCLSVIGRPDIGPPSHIAVCSRPADAVTGASRLALTARTGPDGLAIGALHGACPYIVANTMFALIQAVTGRAVQAAAANRHES